MKLKYYITLFLLFLSFGLLSAQTPANGFTGISIEPNFSWTTAGQFLQISTTSDFAAYTEIDMGGNVTSYALTEENTLDNDETYYWRVVAASGGGTALDGEYHFTTAAGVDITLSAPTNGATVYTTTAMFSWTINTSVGNMKFLLQVDQNSANPSIAEWAAADIAPAAMSNIYYNATGLLQGSDYKWRVIVLNADGDVLEYSSVFGFTTDGGEVVPTLLTPTNGTTVYTTVPTFYWNVNGAGTDLTYEIQIDDDGTFDGDLGDVLNADGLTDLFYTIADGLLDAGQTYYWRVQSVYNGTESGFQAAAWSFDINGGAVVPTLTAPTNGATVYTETPSLYWTVNGDGTDLTYEIEVYDDAAHTTLINSGTSSDLYYTIPDGNLVAGNDYFWRVQSVYKSGTASEVESGFTSDWSFDIAGGLDVTIYHSFPENGTTVYTNDPYVYWYLDQYTTGLTFNIRYIEADAYTLTGGEIDGGTTYGPTSDLFYQFTGLTPGVKHFWQVQPIYNGELGDWTTPTSFTTNGVGTLLQPVNSYPSDGVTLYTTAPYFYWYVNGSSDGFSFDVWLRDITDGGAWIEEESDITSLYVQIEGLTAGHTYEWKVIPGDDASFESDATQFSIIGGVSDGYPVVTYPLSNPTVYTATPMLNWYLEGTTMGLTSFVVKYSTDDQADWEAFNPYAVGAANDATDGMKTIADLSTTYWTIDADLTYGEDYHWAVASFDGADYSAWSEGSFTVVGGANGTSVVLSQPGNGSTVTTTAPTLYWYLNGSPLGLTGYTIDYSESDATWLHQETSTNMSLELSGLTPGATYRWKVTPDYNGTPGTESDVWTFTVDNGSAPVQPIVGGPTNNISVNTSAPMLTWVVQSNAADKMTYKVEILNNNETDWSAAKVMEGVSNPYAVISNLEAGQYYKWRVSSSTDGNYPVPPSFGIFKVDDNVTRVNEEIIPEEFGVKQNYPNPFNPTTTIKYQLAEQAIVTIRIYNMLGQRIATLVNAEQPAGSFEAVWNGKDDFGKKVASGTYIYRVTAGTNTISKKMVLLK